MTNKEFYKEQIFDIACQGRSIAVSKIINDPMPCGGHGCQKCAFESSTRACEDSVKEWCNSEHVEIPVTPTLTKEERALLDMFSDSFKYIRRSYFRGSFHLLTGIPPETHVHESFDAHIFKNVKFDFITRDEPWSIDDLKKLEVIE